MIQTQKAELKYESVIIGGSTGAFRVIESILAQLTGDFSLPIIIIVHRHRHSNTEFEKQLAKRNPLNVIQVELMQPIENGNVYVAPPNYHLLIEEDRTFSLSLEGPVNYARPSIDVTFQSAAHVYGNRLIAILLTGANRDGSVGLESIKKRGGFTIVQSPQSAEATEMPEAAIRQVSPDRILSGGEIGVFLSRLVPITP